MLMLLALLFRLVTLAVAKLPLNKYLDQVFPIILIDTYLDWMLKWLDSLVSSKVCQNKSPKETDRAARG
jgi:hypothetical protein